jgi:hypothetical protein
LALAMFMCLAGLAVGHAVRVQATGPHA